MASQVLSGSGNVTYTNNTGQNVRVIINFYKNNTTSPASSSFVISWAGQSITTSTSIAGFGKHVAYTSSATNQNMTGTSNEQSIAPTEIMLSSGQTFSISGSSTSYPLGPYNILIIPENG